MKKSLKFLLVGIITAFTMCLPNQVWAAAEHKLNLSAVACPMENYADQTGNDQYYACMDDYLNGNLSAGAITSGGNVKPGTTVMVILNYVPGDSKNVVSLNATLRYDSTKWTPVVQEGSDFYDETQFPKTGRKVTWQTSFNVRGPGDISYYSEDTANTMTPISQETELGYVFLKLNDSVQPNDDITLTLGDEPGDTDFSDENGDQVRPYSLTPMTLTAPQAAVSTDATLKTLTVTGGGNPYSLDPTFTPGDATVTSYKAVVPNNIGSVTLGATANDSGATVLPAGLGSKSLSVGDNSFDIVVTAASGATETYTVHVYRLSNDATLSSLTLTNSVSIGALQAGKYNYTATVPYATSSTNVSATATHSKAFVESGTGNWSLTNTGATKNTKTVVVKAENCLTTYASVPGNSCTSQNYTIEITREEASDNNYLSSLTVDGVSVPGFQKTTDTYALSDVANSKSTMTIAADVDEPGKAKIVSGTGTVNLAVGSNSFDVVVEAENGVQRTYTITVNRKSNNTKLASLSVTSTPQGTLSPAFSESASGYTYTYDVSATQITVAATVKDTGKAKIAIVDVSTDAGATGTPQLNSATENFSNLVTKVSVIVTAEDGTVATYPITLSRGKSTNTYLSSLSLSETSLNETFVKTTRTYTATVASNVTSVTVNAVAEDAPRATIKSITGNTSLQFGNNSIVITVKAESGLEEAYTINVTREKSNVATLDDLTIDGTTISGFNKNTFTYTIPGSVDYSKDSVQIGTTKTDTNATVTGDTGTVSLTTGTNTITIRVTAQNGVDYHDYVITMERDKNTDNTVHGLTVAGKTPTLNASGNYEVTLPNGKTTLDPSDVNVSVGDGATVAKGNAISLSTENVNTYQFSVTSESGSTETYTVLITREPSTSTTLSKVTLNIGADSSRSCVMSGDTCTITIPADTTDFTLTTDIPDTSTISPVDGTPHSMALTESTKNITLTVTAEDGTTHKDYTLVVNREQSTINTLDSITVDHGTLDPTFASETTNYTINVDGSVDKIHVEATLTDSRAEIVSGTGDHSLNVGDNSITIRVKSQSGAFNEYKLKVVRAKKSDKDLLDLTVDGTTVPGFNKDTLEYTLTNVPYTTTSILIGVTKSDTDATVTGTGRKALVTGLNTFEVVVKAQDGSEQTYKINVTRDKNNEARLSTLIINGQTLNKTFDKDTFDYEITVAATKDTLSPNEITAIPVDTNATVVKDAELSLSTTIDNYYEINVTAEDGTTQKTYTIKVNRPKSNDATLKKVNVTGGSLSPEVSATETNYTITLPNGVTDFTIEGIANVSTTQVFGNGSYTLADGTVTLTTRAEDGTTSTYTFTIKQTLSNDATLASLSVTDHNLDKTFQATEKDYSIGNVTYGTTQLVVNAVANNIDSTIEYFLDGTKQTNNTINIPNTLGSKTITVKVTAPDRNTTDSYNITYTLVKSSNAFLKSLTPSTGILNPTFVKTTKNYEVAVDGTTTSIDFDIETEDSNAKITVNGETSATPKTVTMSSLAVGENTLTILVTAQDGTEETYTVVVKKEVSVSEVITSDTYGHTIENDFIKTVKLDTIGSQMKDQLDNPNEYLEIWKSDESEKVDDTAPLATGMIVKLMIDGEEKDRKNIVIKGDTSGDGIINLFDAVKILNHVLSPELQGAYLEAAYVNDDEAVNLFDSVMILNHVLGTAPIH